jgi:hypothetical protein
MFGNAPNFALVSFNDFLKQLLSNFSDIFYHIVVFGFAELGSGKKEMLLNADKVHYGNTLILIGRQAHFFLLFRLVHLLDKFVKIFYWVLIVVCVVHIAI